MRKILFAIPFLAICPFTIAQNAMNNDAIVKLAKAGLSDDLIVSTINASPGTYDTSADGIIALKAAGASDKVVAAIVAKASSLAAPVTPPSQPPAAATPPPTANGLPSGIAAVAPPAEQGKVDNAAQKSVGSLADVHTIYIAPMANGFDQYLTGEIVNRLPKGVTVAPNKSGADAILEGSDEQSGSGVGRTVNQVFGVGGSASGAVRLVSSDGKIFWATEKSDHTIPLYGTFREHGMPKVAARIAKDLATALQTAQERRK